jgi:beta-galactosidase
VSIVGKNFHLVLDRASGELKRQDGDGALKLIRFPRLFVTRQETRNPFNPGGVPYAQYPDQSTRAIDSVTVKPSGEALAIEVKDHYAGYSGYASMVVDDDGLCTASFDYTYSGEAFTASEMGLQFLMDKGCREISWRRQTEWDVYPEDHIGRPEGRANAEREAKWGSAPMPFGKRPPWPWHLDSNQFGTRDFRATKYNVYEAAIMAPDGSGMRVHSDASANVRACLAPEGVQFHVLVSRPYAPLSSGGRLSGTFVFRLLPGGTRPEKTTSLFGRSISGQ